MKRLNNLVIYNKCKNNNIDAAKCADECSSKQPTAFGTDLGQGYKGNPFLRTNKKWSQICFQIERTRWQRKILNCFDYVTKHFLLIVRNRNILAK